jgi:hypothetical protein
VTSGTLRLRKTSLNRPHLVLSSEIAATPGRVSRSSSSLINTIGNVPQITLRHTIDGREETLSEYICDWPDCPKVAVSVVGIVRELRTRTAMCAEHAARFANRKRDEPPQ